MFQVVSIRIYAAWTWTKCRTFDWIFHDHTDEKFRHCGCLRYVTSADTSSPHSEPVFRISAYRPKIESDLSIAYTRHPQRFWKFCGDKGLSSFQWNWLFRIPADVSHFLSLTRVISAEYIKQCDANDPKLVECIKGALHHLRPWLRTGIQEIQVSWTSLKGYESSSIPNFRYFVGNFNITRCCVNIIYSTDACRWCLYKSDDIYMWHGTCYSYFYLHF